MHLNTLQGKNRYFPYIKFANSCLRGVKYNRLNDIKIIFQKIMPRSQGLKFKKFDLQVHTPASEDFEDRNATPDDIVEAALTKGLSGIAITDHQTGAWIDSVKAAAKGKGLTVFPGVELKVHGGKEGIHLLILFDTDKESKYISAFLNTLNVYDHNGKPDVIANKTAIDVAKELQNFDSKAILVLSHCHSSQGVISDMRGEQRSEIFKPEWTCLLGAEANEKDFTDPKKIQNHDRIVDLLDGGYDNYHYKKLGVYQSSDSHKLSDIGKRFTYFKVDDPITIEDIRQSLIDRDTRIRQSFEYKENSYPRIDSLKITSGFLSDQEFEFHEGLNSILGAKGCGKSLAIELLRFGLNQPPHNEDLINDHESKLERCLKTYGAVEIKITDDSGKQYIIIRTFNPGDNDPLEITDPTDGSKKEFQIEQVFPVLFLSQNEIIKLAEDKTGSSQREFIDRFFDFYKFQNEITLLERELQEADAKFADVLKAHLRSIDLKKKLASSKEEVERLGRQIKNTIFEQYSKKEKIGQAIKTKLDFVDSLEESLNTTLLEYTDLSSPTLDDEATNSDPAVKRTEGKIKEILTDIQDNIRNVISSLKKKRSEIELEYTNWKTGFNPIKIQYDKVVKESGGTQIALDPKKEETYRRSFEARNRINKISSESPTN